MHGIIHVHSCCLICCASPCSLVAGGTAPLAHHLTQVRNNWTNCCSLAGCAVASANRVDRHPGAGPNFEFRFG
jgi:hypothetical protein